MMYCVALSFPVALFALSKLTISLAFTLSVCSVPLTHVSINPFPLALSIPFPIYSLLVPLPIFLIPGMHRTWVHMRVTGMARMPCESRMPRMPDMPRMRCMMRMRQMPTWMQVRVRIGRREHPSVVSDITVAPYVARVADVPDIPRVACITHVSDITSEAGVAAGRRGRREWCLHARGISCTAHTPHKRGSMYRHGGRSMRGWREIRMRRNQPTRRRKRRQAAL
jgi:hypothetical protein